LQVGSNREGNQGDCRMKLETLGMQSDSRFYEELYELKVDIEKLKLWMRQDRRSRRMRELPMKKEKEK